MFDISLVGGWATPLKIMSSSVGMIIPYGKTIQMFQTTNQYHILPLLTIINHH